MTDHIITGEKYQLDCDYFIGETKDFNFNPQIRSSDDSRKVNIKSSTFPKVDKSVKIFCYTHILTHNFKKLFDLLNTVETTFILYFHNSDGLFERGYQKLFELPNLEKIYTQNINCKPNEKLIPIGIGIANSMWRHGNLKIWESVLLKPIEKSNFIYCFFNIDTCKGKRSYCFNVIQKKEIPIQKNTEYSRYLELLRTFKYAICPEGYGLDTHRFWECVYLDVVPICLKNHITEYFSKQYPVILLDKWEDLDIDNIDKCISIPEK